MAQGRGTFGSADIAAGLTELSALLLSVEEIEDALVISRAWRSRLFPMAPTVGSP